MYPVTGSAFSEEKIELFIKNLLNITLCRSRVYLSHVVITSTYPACARESSAVIQPSHSKTLIQCWFNVGPASQTMGTTLVQQWFNIGTMSCV